MPLKLKKVTHQTKIAKSRKVLALENTAKVSLGSSLSSPLFIPIVGLVLFFWFSYRSLFSFPVWFDESIGKAIFFGLPVWLFVVMTGARQIVETLEWSRFKKGLWLGVAIGGVFGFAGAILAAWQKGGAIQPAQLFAADGFWFEFGLAVLTAFWETLFFFSFIQSIIQGRLKSWGWLNQAILTAVIFLVFHIPNAILRFNGVAIGQQLLLLFFFGLGQALLFTREKNAYALILSHAIWGMVLLVHF